VQSLTPKPTSASLKLRLSNEKIQSEFCAAETQAGSQGEHIARIISILKNCLRCGKVENPKRVGELERAKPILKLERPWIAIQQISS
jgi:hypothetical protein